MYLNLTTLQVLSDTYRTIGNNCEGLFKDKGSKFISYAFPVETEERIKELIEQLVKQHHSARHHCWAYRLKPDGSVWRINDDGEPSNSAGKPILGQIQAKNLTNVLIVVVRYFGGTLLGVGGLIQAYKQSAADALEKVEIVEKIIENEISFSFPASLTGDVMRLIKQYNAKIKIQEYDILNKINCNIRMGMETSFRQQIENIHGIIIH